MARIKPTFDPVARTAPTADGPPAAPPTLVPVSDIPSKKARNNGHICHSGPDGGDCDNGAEHDFSLAGMIQGRPDPDLDLVTKSYAIPRYLAEALRLYTAKTRRPAQATVADGLRLILPDHLQQACRDRA